MKQIIFLPALLFGLLMVSQSCSKEAQNETRITEPGKIITATVSSTKPYTLNVTGLGDVSISKQAKHFTVSQTETDVNDGMLVYKYIPEKGYAGTDEVEILTLKTNSGGSGNGCSNGGGENTTAYNSTIIIKFTVSD